MSDVVLDASALLALLQGKPGADVVAACLSGALMCTVNHSEVVAKLADAGMPDAAIVQALQLPIELVDFDAELSARAGLLRPMTRALGLSLGDRASLALALSRGLEAVTTEPTWEKVPRGPRLRIIRKVPTRR